MSDLYLLQDGTHADPSDCSQGKDGLLRHKNGLAVCLYEDGKPQTVAEDAHRNKNVDAAKAGEPVADVPAQPMVTVHGKTDGVDGVTAALKKQLTLAEERQAADAKESAPMWHNVPANPEDDKDAAKPTG